MAEWKVPLFELKLEEDEHEGVRQVLASNWLTMGEVTRAFESAFAEYLGAKHAVAVNSATAALHLAYHALGLGPGDEVICPSLTFVATANAILYTGAKVVFADISGGEDLTISPDDIESRINDKTKAIVVVHYAGFACDMDRILEIARNHGLFVVEDAAHAPGADYGGRKLGAIGDVGCFSFFGNKNMTTAEGGMVVTDSDEIAEKIKVARSHGMTSLTWDRFRGHDFSYDVIDLGYNYRIDDLRSSLGLAQLRKLDTNNQRRRAAWELYRQRLNSVEEIRMPFSGFRGNSSYHICPVLLSGRVDRNGLMGYMREHGVQTSVHYPPVHLFSYYKGLIPSNAGLPRTEYVGSREVTLPLYPSIDEQQIDHVVECIRNFLVS